MFTVLRQFSKYPLRWKFLNDVRHFARVKTVNEDTLTGRFMLFLSNSRIPETSCKVDLVSLLERRTGDIKTFDVSQILALLGALHHKDLTATNKRALLQLVDFECCNRMKQFDVEQIFTVLSAFTNVVSHRVIDCHCFQPALHNLLLQKSVLSKEQLVHLMFLIGLLKKCEQAQNMIKQCIKLLDKDVIDNLTKEELCIVCNAAFKTSTKIRNEPMLAKIKQFIQDNLVVLEEPAVFVTLIKTLRHNRHLDEDILSTITCTILFNNTLGYYSFGALCHILALYADYLYHDEALLNALVGRSMQLLKSCPFKSSRAHVAFHPREKDIKRFLWALSNLNYGLSRQDIETVLLPAISERMYAGGFTTDPGALVQIALYLWMLQYKARDLIKACVTEESVRVIRGQNLPSQDSLNLLLICIYYEDPELFSQLNICLEKPSQYNWTIQLNKRPLLCQIINSLKRAPLENKIDQYKMVCQVPFINIVGVVGLQKRIYKTVNVEVLDEYTCLKNTNSAPTGFMQLKLRLLGNRDEGLVVIEQNDVAECTESELQHILCDEIALVC